MALASCSIWELHKGFQSNIQNPTDQDEKPILKQFNTSPPKSSFNPIAFKNSGFKFYLIPWHGAYCNFLSALLLSIQRHRLKAQRGNGEEGLKGKLHANPVQRESKDSLRLCGSAEEKATKAAKPLSRSAWLSHPGASLRRSRVGRWIFYSRPQYAMAAAHLFRSGRAAGNPSTEKSRQGERIGEGGQGPDLCRVRDRRFLESRKPQWRLESRAAADSLF
ncbi:uncharacterized protein VTP21DRAFT_5555 [Calcarisporiella thermophila]|uniref:uncharacterized protein n=1 Tax=Calcarisporiella thermophila TaxID=911321 RepID=UPI00374415F9